MPEAKTLGPKGQVVIPKRIRARLGLREGSKVVFEERGAKEVVLRPQESPEEFVERFCSPPGRSRRRVVDFDRIYEEQLEERLRVPAKRRRSRA